VLGCLLTAGVVPAAVADDDGATARGWSWEKLVMPGLLAAPHADIESDCAQCHRAFDVSAEAELCVACHEDVAGDLERGRGFHGRVPGLREGGDCRSCHAEHRGRDFDIAAFDTAHFDHSRTEFALEGGHRALDCQECHVPKADETYRDAPTRCIACHGDDDVHEGRFGEDCASCHSLAGTAPGSGWQAATFDHDETDFPLTGAHADARCSLCHGDARYEATPKDCLSCHRLNDAHRGGFGTDCASCHETDAWKRSAFDHEAASGFALRGSHASAACESCHVEAPGSVELPTACGDCHRSDDAHRGANGNDCASCHDANSWKHSSFDHAKTGFGLEGAHADVACETCHGASVYDPELESDCVACHRADDVHAGQLGEDCAGCHSVSAFSRDVFFDHELTRFPLLGMHSAVACEECHATQRFRDAGTACASCHRGDDAHDGGLGRSCETCHNPNAWAVWHFDHDTQTAFALHGSHEGLACSSCHSRAVAGKASASSQCESCHARDDAHRGSFGRDCGLCHGDRAWKPAKITSRGRSRTESPDDPPGREARDDEAK